MDFPRWLRWCLLVFVEEALVGFFGTRDMMTQFWPAVAPFLTILGVGSGLAALSMFFDRWMADYKKWRREQTAQQQEALRRRQADEPRRLRQAHWADFMMLKSFLGAEGKAAPTQESSLRLFSGSLRKWGSSEET